jgi:serine-type D-Ala-D-Ala carboxypeptidase/endopeptidase (penicillin-binding protein 4)
MTLFKYLTPVFLTLCTYAAHAALPQSVQDALTKAGVSDAGVSVYVQGVDADQPLISHNASKAMNPASVMKLVTSYAALDVLSPAFRWTTEVYRDGEVVNGTLKGNLIIKGGGDPSFKAQDFWRLLMSLQQAGITAIDGDLIIDKSYFAKSIGNRKTFDEETWRAYNAEPSAFLVNGRNTSFKFSVLNNHVAVNQEFELPEVSVVNKMQVRAGECGSWRNFFNYVVSSFKKGTVVTFTGRYSPNCQDRYLELSVLDDSQYAFNTFKKLWTEIGGKFNGNLQLKDTPANAVKVLVQPSEPLSYVINDLNKWSINVMARQLLLTLAAEQQKKPATEALGQLTIKQWLADKGLNFSELVIENGSGLSRVERISAQHLGQMLVSAYRSPVMPELMSSMPILGVDGTVKKRLETDMVKGRAHLKTGSLDGVSAIAGYLLDQKGKRYVVVMLVNDAKAWASKPAQDALLQSVFN